MNSRKFTRVGFARNGFLTAFGVRYRVRILNIALKGVLLELDEEDPQILKEPQITDEPVEFFFPLIEKEIEIRASAKIVHILKNQVGLQFIVIDALSMIHLRRLLELNTANPSLIASELPFLKEDKPIQD